MPLLLKLLFLFLLFFQLKSVQGCLVVNFKSPDLGKCKCSVDILNQRAVQKNEGGNYLGNQKIWSPVVTAKDDCSLSITCKAVPGVSSFFTVLFRSNGSPHYINRVVANHSTFIEQPRSIANLTCSEDTDGSWQWFYYGSPIYDLSLSCISDEDSCKCEKVKDDTWAPLVSRYPDAKNQCDFFSSSCPGQYPGLPILEFPFLFSDNNAGFHTGSEDPRALALFEDLFCLKDSEGSFNWHYFNLKLLKPHVFCHQNAIYNDGEQHDQCGHFLVADSMRQLVQRKSRVDGWERAEFQEKSNWERKVGEFDITCEQGYTPVVFSANNDPIVLRQDAATVKCVPNPLNSYMKLYIVKGTHLINPAGACILSETIPQIKMNRCPCPYIDYADQMMTYQLGGQSSYLHLRQTRSPPLMVSDSCEVTFDARSMANLDYNFMIFREEAPPIFMRRFLPTSSPSKNISIPDLTCQKIGSAHHWYYGTTSKISSEPILVAFQINDPGCSCSYFTSDPNVKRMELVNDVCDLVRFECMDEQYGVEIKYRPNSGPVANMEQQQIIRTFNNNITIVGATCLNDRFYFNGIEATFPEVSCLPRTDDLDYLEVAEQCPCAKQGMFRSPSEADFKSFWDRFEYYYPGSGAFKNRTATEIRTSYIVDECRSENFCNGDDDTFVVFSMNNKPMVYPSPSKPDMRCVSPPNSGSFQTEHYWWIDNIMTSMPVYACFPKIPEIDTPEIQMNGCKCPQIYYIDQEGIREKMGEYSAHLAGKETFKPNVTVTEKCEVTVDVSSHSFTTHSIVLFRKDAPPITMHSASEVSNPIPLTSLKCARPVFGAKYQWRYNDLKISDDVIYFAVQKEAESCSCNENSMDYDVTQTAIQGFCDKFQYSCQNPEWVPNFFAMIEGQDGGILVDYNMNNYTLIGTSCINSQWFFNGIAISEWYVGCFRRFGDDDWSEFANTCTCTHPALLDEPGWEESYKGRPQSFDKKGLFMNQHASNGVHSFDKNGCFMDYICETDDDNLVVFSFEYEPMVFSNTERPEIRCVSPPSALLSPPTEHYWWIDNILISFAQFACFPKPDEFQIEMNGCQCPPLWNIDQSRIASFPESSYLKDRETFRPKVEVKANCEVTVDASFMEIDDFYLMLFRRYAPPVFMHRFYTPTDRTSPIILTDLKCVRNLNIYQWNYKNVKLTNNKPLYITLQSNEESCGCEDFQVTNTNKMAMTKVDGKCDVMKFSCFNSPSYEGMQLMNNEVAENGGAQKVAQGIGNDVTLTAAVCVNSQWIFNGIPLTSPSVNCGDQYDIYDLDFEDYAQQCKCSQFKMHKPQPANNTEYWNWFTLNYDQAKEYTNRSTTGGSGLIYSVGDCTIKYICSMYDQDLVVFSLNRKPMVFANGESPQIACVSPPSATYSKNDHYWWIDDSVVVMPYIACFQKESWACKCPMLYEAHPNRLGYLDASKYLAHRQQFTPKIHVTESCDVSLDVSRSTVDNFFLLIIRTDATPIFLHRYYASQDKNVLAPLEELKCNLDGNTYVWQHDGVTINPIEMTLVSDEECGCPDFPKVDETGMTVPEITKIDGSCNSFHFKCPSDDWTVSLHDGTADGKSLIANLPWDVDFPQMTCVNKTWHYNNYQIQNPKVLCFTKGDSGAAKCHCTHPTVINESDWEANYKGKPQTFDKNGEFKDQSASNGKLVFDGCSMNYNCENDNDNLVVFSNELEPMVFLYYERPEIRCATGPSDLSPQYWWINNKIVSSAHFACFPPGSK